MVEATLESVKLAFGVSSDALSAAIVFDLDLLPPPQFNDCEQILEICADLDEVPNASPFIILSLLNMCVVSFEILGSIMFCCKSIYRNQFVIHNIS